MKLLLFICLFTVAQAFAHEKVALNGHIYVPQGFDGNDTVEITAIGVLPDSCHKNPTFSIQRRGSSYTIQLFAYKMKGSKDCRKISTPYFETINFGMMNPGKYKIELMSKQYKEKSELIINPASTALMDDFLYGNVTGLLEDEVTRDITLIGVNPSNCLVFDKMATEKQDKIIILRPQFKEVGFCENKPSPFEIKYKVPFIKDGPQGVLLHVRVMNGRSFNYLYQNRL